MFSLSHFLLSSHTILQLPASIRGTPFPSIAISSSYIHHLKSPVALGKVDRPSGHGHGKTLCAKVSNSAAIKNTTNKTESVCDTEESEGSKSVVQVLSVTTVDLDDTGEGEDDWDALDEVGVGAVGEVQRV